MAGRSSSVRVPRWITLLTLVALGASCNPGYAASLTLGTVDSYGTARWTADEVRTKFGTALEDYVAASSRQDVDSSFDIRNRILAAINERGPFAYAEISAIQTGAPLWTVNVTFDVVEPVDAARRMPFRAAPSAKLEDPDGLLARWHTFEALGFPLSMAGKIGRGDRDCPVLHCLFAFDDPALAPFLEEFNRGARKHEKTLRAIAARDADPERRKSAVYLIAHTNHAEALLDVAKRGIYDPSGSVRNAAMRVLITLIPKRPELRYPLEDLVVALDFPEVSDRNKAAYALERLARDPKHRPYLRKRAVPVLLRLLTLQQPINHDPAYAILKLISDENFPERDFEAWNAWAASIIARAD